MWKQLPPEMLPLFRGRCCAAFFWGFYMTASAFCARHWESGQRNTSLIRQRLCGASRGGGLIVPAGKCRVRTGIQKPNADIFRDGLCSLSLIFCMPCLRRACSRCFYITEIQGFCAGIRCLRAPSDFSPIITRSGARSCGDVHFCWHFYARSSSFFTTGSYFRFCGFCTGCCAVSAADVLWCRSTEKSGGDCAGSPAGC